MPSRSCLGGRGLRPSVRPATAMSPCPLDGEPRGPAQRAQKVAQRTAGGQRGHRERNTQISWGMWSEAPEQQSLVLEAGLSMAKLVLHAAILGVPCALSLALARAVSLSLSLSLSPLSSLPPLPIDYCTTPARLSPVNSGHFGCQQATLRGCSSSIAQHEMILWMCCQVVTCRESSLGQVVALRAHCVHLLGNSPKITCHTGS